MWLYIAPSVFIWRTESETLLYNSASGSGFIFSVKRVSGDLVERLMDPVLMYCTEVSVTEMADSLTRKFIEKVLSSKSGGLLENNVDQTKPVVLFPSLNIQRSVEIQKRRENYFKDDKVMLDLHELSIYFDGMSDATKSLWHKQFVYPLQTDAVIESKSLLRQLSVLSTTSGLKCINIIASYLNRVETLAEITDSLCRINAQKVVWCRLDDYKNNMSATISRLYEGNFMIKIIVDPVISIENTRKQLLEVSGAIPEASFSFIITGERDYDNAAELFELIRNKEEITINPLFTGENYNFFVENVFIRREGLLNAGLNRRQVFAHQAVNTFDFGKISLMPDGFFYANHNHPPVGSVDENLKDVLHRELFSGRSWRRIRDSAPCTDCIYQWLCPSPSNYELVIGKPDLCTHNVSKIVG